MTQLKKFIKVCTAVLMTYLIYIGTMLLIGLFGLAFGLTINFGILSLIGFIIASFIVLIFALQYKHKNKLNKDMD